MLLLNRTEELFFFLAPAKPEKKEEGNYFCDKYFYWISQPTEI